MEFELFDLRTGETFRKTVTPLAKALQFKDKCQYSKKLLVLSYKYL